MRCKHMGLELNPQSPGNLCDYKTTCVQREYATLETKSLQESSGVFKAAVKIEEKISMQYVKDT